MKVVFKNLGDSAGEPAGADTAWVDARAPDHEGADHEEVRVESNYIRAVQADAGRAQAGGGGIGVARCPAEVDDDSVSCAWLPRLSLVR
jgi:hypothetical protein